MKKIILGIITLVIVIGGYVAYQSQKDNRPAQVAVDIQEIISPWDSFIEEYLLSQENFVWKTEEDSQTACVFEKLEENKILFPMSLWVSCQEYKIENGKKKELSGSSLPVLLNYPKHLSFLDVSHFSHQIPRDGSFYSEDIKKIFSKKAQEEIFSYYLEDGLQDKMDKKINLLILEKETALNPEPINNPDNLIQLPENIISEKDCVAKGGEVWNSLGETSYNGKLIGKIEGLLCPCACRVAE